jgi:ferrous iron transport protein A
LVPLSLIKEGDRVQVEKILGTGYLASTLSQLGIIVGEELMVVQKVNESVIIRIRGSRYALGTGAACMVMVNPLSGAA